jgi:integrase/recombinase XerD
MPRKGQRLKVRKRSPVKPKGFGKRAHDPLGHVPLLAYMNLHFEALLVAGYSADTVRARRVAIRRFIAWCDERGLSKPADITKQVLERYQRHLFYYRKPDGQPMTLASQKGCLAPLKTLFKWLARENHILFNPASEMELPPDAQRLPRSILSVREVESILTEANVTTPAGLRDRALLELLYSTAIRRTEAAGLAVYDIDFDRRLAMVREGKGRKDRVVPIGERALAWLDKYLLEGRPQLMTRSHEALFVTDYGEAPTPEFIALRVRKYMDFAGIDKPGATHLLRHACATHMLERGADIRFLQAMLGHAQLNTTEIYTHVAIEKLQAIHAATHPAKLHRLEAGDTTPAHADEGERQSLTDILASD